MTAGTRILVVEDDELLQKMMRRALERAGFSVAQASTRADLVSEVTRAVSDLVVLDLRLPDMARCQRLATLKQDPKTSTIPIVVWTSIDSEVQRHQVFELGAAVYVKKGPPSVLLFMIRQLLHVPRH